MVKEKSSVNKQVEYNAKQWRKSLTYISLRTKVITSSTRTKNEGFDSPGKSIRVLTKSFLLRANTNGCWKLKGDIIRIQIRLKRLQVVLILLKIKHSPTKNRVSG